MRKLLHIDIIGVTMYENSKSKKTQQRMLATREPKLGSSGQHIRSLNMSKVNPKS